MLEVGTIPYPDSFTSGIKSFMLADLYRLEFLFDTIPIRRTLFDFANFIIFRYSFVFPE